jgi:hypothetical protein
MESLVHKRVLDQFPALGLYEGAEPDAGGNAVEEHESRKQSGKIHAILWKSPVFLTGEVRRIELEALFKTI